MDEVLADEALRFSTAATRMSTVRPASFVDVDSFMTPKEIRDDPVRIGCALAVWARMPAQPSQCRAGRSLCSSSSAAWTIEPTGKSILLCSIA
ncbi:hypothetical protein [Mesorhizobium sp.]|uniref:hypothetical protein n=1 Tax=Mesorhizobium sp. TaxID=1871066 RepID=UPI0025DC5F30|nr:hypothetical protein [Mesorhizobium sp.]